jgi:hypothetical protein
MFSVVAYLKHLASRGSFQPGISLSTESVITSNVRTLFQVTAQATQAKIALLIGSQVLLGDNMIDLVRQQGGALRQATILTGVLRVLLYPRASGLRHR